jgi:hypothetical protein
MAQFVILNATHVHYRSLDDGVTWSQPAQNTFIRDVVGVRKGSDAIYYAIHISTRNLYRSLDFGNTFQAIGAAIPGTGAIRALAILPSGRLVVLVDTPDRLAVYTDNEGTTWTSVSLAGVAASIERWRQLYAGPPNTLLAVVTVTETADTLIRSSDGGTTWAQVATVSTEFWDGLFRTRAGTWLAVRTPRRFRTGARTQYIMRSTTDGASWAVAFAESLPDEQPAWGILSVEIRNKIAQYASGRLVAINPPGLATPAYMSDDDGASWTHTDATRGQGYGAYQHGGTILWATVISGVGRLYRTTDGSTWHSVLAEKDLHAGASIGPPVGGSGLKAARMGLLAAPRPRRRPGPG